MGMGSSGGGTKNQVGTKQTRAQFDFWLDPSMAGMQTDGASGSKWLSPGVKDAIAAGTEFGGYYQGAPGVGTFTSDGRYIAPGSDERLPTTMPGYEAFANYDTLYENYDRGNLSPSQSAIMGNAQSILTGDTANSGGYFNQVMNSGLGAGSGGAGGGVPAPPDFANRTLNVDNIGALTGDIFDDMPEPMRNFAIDMLNTSDPSYVEESINGFKDEMMAYVEDQVARNSLQVSDVYAAQGLSGSGAFVAGMIDMTTRTTIEASARVSEYALQRYSQIVAQQGVAQSIMDSLLDAGAAEQTNRVQFEMQKLSSEAQAYGAYASASAQVQSALANANAQIQATLIGSAADLERTRMSYQNDQLGLMYGENAQTNAQNTAALSLPLTSMYNQQSNQPLQGGTGGGISGVGEALTGITGLGGALGLFGGAAGGAMPSVLAAGALGAV